jgi:hypothetical protein
MGRIGASSAQTESTAAGENFKAHDLSRFSRLGLGWRSGPALQPGQPLSASVAAAMSEADSAGDIHPWEEASAAKTPLSPSSLHTAMGATRRRQREQG